MEVRILECMAGVDFVRDVGDVVDIDEAEALRLIKRGYAEATKPETATKKTSKRTAVKPKAAKRDDSASNSSDD